MKPFLLIVAFIALAGCSNPASSSSTTSSTTTLSPPTGVVTTLAGSTQGSTDGTGTAARFYFPSSNASDGTNLYVVDSMNNMIRKIVIATGVVTTFAGSTTADFVDGTGTAARFNNLVGITTDGTNLYVADTGNNRIRKIVIATGVVSTLAGSGATGSTDGTGTAAKFYNPEGIAYSDGNLYVADSQNNTVRKVVIATAVVTTLAGSTTSGSTDGTGAAARFNNLESLAADGTNVYVADFNNNLIRKVVIATGVVTTLAGSTTAGSTDGTGTAARFTSPTGVATDGTNLYVADAGNNLIRKIIIATGVVTTLAGSTTSGSTDGTGTAARFNQPWGVAMASNDPSRLFVADSYNNTIRMIQ